MLVLFFALWFSPFAAGGVRFPPCPRVSASRSTLGAVPSRSAVSKHAHTRGGKAGKENKIGRLEVKTRINRGTLSFDEGVRTVVLLLFNIRNSRTAPEEEEGRSRAAFCVSPSPFLCLFLCVLSIVARSSAAVYGFAACAFFFFAFLFSFFSFLWVCCLSALLFFS